MIFIYIYYLLNWIKYSHFAAEIAKCKSASTLYLRYDSSKEIKVRKTFKNI